MQVTVARNIGFVVLFGCLLNPSGLCQDLKHGVVVESVASHLEGDKAGLQSGDIILRWTRADAQGTIESPFDLSATEVEQAPRGSVVLEGVRSTEKRSWTMGPSKWSIEARPQMPDSLLALYRQGQQTANAGKPAEAAESWKLAASQAQDPTAVWFRFQITSMWAATRRWDEDDKAYQETLDATAGTGPAIRAQLFRSWADAYRSRSDWRHAEACYQQSIAESQKITAESLMIAKNLTDLGNISLQRGDLTKGEEYHFQALTIRQKLAAGSLDLATSFHGLGNAAYIRGDLAKAEEYHRQALDIRQLLSPGSLDVAASLNNIGNIAKDQGNLAKADEYYHKSLDIKLKVTPGSLDLATTLNNLGLVAWSRGDLAQAEEYHRQALDIRQRLAPGSLGVAASLGNLGLIASDRGDLVTTEEYYLRGLEIQERLAPGSLLVASSLNNLGNIAWSRGNPAKAGEYFSRALAIQENLAPGRLELALTVDNLGLVAGARGDLVKAELYHRQALEIRQKLAPGSLDVAASLSNLGFVAGRRGDSLKAEEYYHQALDIMRKLAPESVQTAEVYNNLGDLIRLGDRQDLTKAEEYYRQALTIQGKLAPESKDHAESLASLAGVLRRKGQPDSATQLYEQALHAFESQTARLGGAEETRANFRADHSNYFLDYIDLLMVKNKPDLAFQVAERWRARSLLETLAEAHLDIRQGVDPDLRARERSLQELLQAKSDRRIKLLTAEHVDEKQVSGVEKEFEDLRSQYSDLQVRIRNTSPAYAALIHPRPLGAKETQQLLDDDTVLLEYALGNDRSYVWAVTSESLHGYKLPGRSKIEGLARHLNRLLSTPKGASVNAGETEAARRERWLRGAATLSRMILGPLAREITGKRLLIVSDGALQYIPFAALPVPGNSRNTPLVTQHEIVYAPSASVIAELRREALGRKPAPKIVVVLADPVFDKNDPRVERDGQKSRGHAGSAAGEPSSSFERLSRSVADLGLAHLSRLAFSRREADAIMAVTPPGQGKAALGFEASRNTAMSQELAQYRIVHFATHALSDSRHPELSGLVLSMVDRQGSPQDGFLDLQQIYNLNLPVELAVLSACETGLGREVRGEGLVGLTRGFMYAGATRVLGSLWSADDVATKELMQRFYQAMEQQGLRPSAALRKAQVSMLRRQRWSAPYYWAAFQLQGEWK